jgi:hypothetical protein
MPYIDREIRLAKQREYSRNYYLRNKEAQKAKAKRWNEQNRIINRDRLLLYLIEHPCVDCGESDPEVLDFDHRDGDSKMKNVTDMLMHFAWSKIEIEIAKCDVRCANCHRRKTNRQFGYWRILPS